LNCGGSECRSGVYAYVFPNDRSHNIYLCDAWYRGTQSRSWDSTAGTVIHETSHFSDVLGTKDI